MIRFRLCIFGRNITEVQLFSFYGILSSDATLICLITGLTWRGKCEDLHSFCHLIKVMLARVLHYEVTLLHFVINKYFEGIYFEAT